MKNTISLINANFGEGYADAYFVKGALKKEYHYLQGEHSLIIFSFQADQSTTIKLNIVVVEKSYQNKGEGAKLLNVFFEKYSSAYDILIPLWNYEGSEGLKKWILQKEGKLLESFNDYWRQDSLEKGYECMQCGAPPCLCRMDLYKISRG